MFIGTRIISNSIIFRYSNTNTSMYGIGKKSCLTIAAPVLQPLPSHEGQRVLLARNHRGETRPWDH